jgi:putative DNA primase/helicase
MLSVQREQETKATTQKNVNELELTFSEGQRNDNLFRTACSLRSHGVNAEAIAEALISINASQCSPPLPEREVRTIARQSARYPAGRALPQSAEWDDSDVLPPLPECDDEAFFSLLSETEAVGVNFGYEFNDSGNAQRLIDKHGEDIRYCYPWRKWLAWDGRRWEMDAQYILARHAEDVVSEMLRDALSIPKSDDGAIEAERAAAIRFAKSSGNKPRIAAMIDLAQAGHMMPVAPERLDKGKYLLNCSNGTLDLKTGHLRPFDRADYLTRAISTPYEPDAACPLWDRFMYRIMGCNPKLVDFMRRAIGYSLSGDTSEQCAFILHGGGANGKSTMLGALQRVMGDYAKQAAADTFMEKKGDNSAGYDLAALWGARLVTSVETRDGRKLDEAVIKQATGGDVVTCRRMREDFWEYAPEYKLFLATNHRPVIRGTDNGIWRRIRLIPFNVAIPDREKDKKLSEKLATEAPGILAWAVRGFLEWQESGLREPNEVLASTQDYRNEQDVLGAFLDECCLIGPEYSDTSQNIYAAYVRWAKETGVFAHSQRKLILELGDRGFEENNTMYAKGRRGLTVKP